MQDGLPGCNASSGLSSGGGQRVKGLEEGEGAPLLGGRAAPAPALLHSHELHHLPGEGDSTRQNASAKHGSSATASGSPPQALGAQQPPCTQNSPAARRASSPLWCWRTRGSACSQARLSRKARRVRRARKSSGVSQYSLRTAARVCVCVRGSEGGGVAGAAAEVSLARCHHARSAPTGTLRCVSATPLHAKPPPAHPSTRPPPPGWGSHARCGAPACAAPRCA